MMNRLARLANISQERDCSSDPPPSYSSVFQIPAITSIPGVPVPPDLSLELTCSSGTALIKITPTPGIHRAPVNICCVVDVSGSMDETATFQTESGVRESDGLTILDLVKHSMRTMLSTMTEADALSIVTFSTDAKVVFPVTKMSPSGKTAAMAVMESLKSDASTNLWAGVELGWDTIRSNRIPASINSVFLFTDGMPNIVPPRGHMGMIAKYVEKHGLLPSSLNTFGFGYSLESELLDEMARFSGGHFVFIPDSSFVGTAFINATANLYTVMAENVKLRLSSSKGLEKMGLKVRGGYGVKDTETGKEICVGAMHCGQTREFILEFEAAAGGEQLIVFLDYELSSVEKKLGEKQGNLILSSDSSQPITCNSFRPDFVDAVEQTLKSNGDRGPIDAILGKYKSSLDLTDPITADLLKDIEGQVAEALIPAYFTRWGKHYLYSLADGHRSQLCNNFKDPGVQHYGSPLFRALRDNFDEIFNQLPPPKATRKGTRSGPVNMRLYNSSRGPCFHGDCVVKLADGGNKLVQYVKKGDILATLDNGSAIIEHIVKTTQNDGTADLVSLPGGLLITPYHPVFDETAKIWKFPLDILEPTEHLCDAVYSFVLKEGASNHSVLINGVGVVTLGHGVVGDVREHPYFGTDKVIKDIQRCNSLTGVVNCTGIITDPGTGLVCGMSLNPEEKGKKKHLEHKG